MVEPEYVHVHGLAETPAALPDALRNAVAQGLADVQRRGALCAR